MEQRLLLASSSPRRKEILRLLGISFTSIHPDIDESVCDHLDPADRVVALARLKAEAGLALSGHPTHPGPVLAADTLVALRLRKAWMVVGKPASAEEAASMLSLLQGRTQHVFTGLCLLAPGAEPRTALSHSTVRFASLSAAEIAAYVATGEWRGAAGAYRVQGWGGAVIERLSGSPSGVMGLPIRELYGILQRTDAPASDIFRPLAGLNRPRIET